MDVLQLLDFPFSPFSVGAVSIETPFILAPMDGISDSPFRGIARQLGSALSYTEFINCADVVHSVQRVAELCSFTEEERPIVFQLYDEDPERIIIAAKILADQYHPNMIDINLGCSVRKISGRGAGVGLMRSPEKVEKIFSGLSSALEIPFSAKIRLGWDKTEMNYLEIGKIIQDCGAGMIALHARTREQHFDGHVDLGAIARLKETLTIPVIGNGDIQTPADALAMMRETGCDAVMIGRAAIANPWIFAVMNLENVPRDEALKTILLHCKKMLEFYGEERGAMIFRKYAKRYLTMFGADPIEIRELITEVPSQLFYECFAKIISACSRGKKNE